MTYGRPRSITPGHVLAGGFVKRLADRSVSRGRKRKRSASASRSRTSKSYSTTKRRKSTKTVTADNQFGGVYSYAGFKFGKHKLSKTVKMLTPVNEIISIDNRSIVIGKSSVGYEQMMNMTFGDLNNIMYVQKRMIASLVSGTTTSLQFPEKLLLQSAYSEYRITNNCQHACELIIYDICTKRDATENPLSVFQADITGLNIDRLTTGLPSGSDAQLLYYSYGMNIQESPGFNTFYKVTKKAKMILAPGEHHIHKQFAKYGGKIASWELNQVSTGYWKGYTYGCVFQATGSTVVGSENNKPLLGEGRIDIVASHKTKARALALPRKHIEYFLKAGCTLGQGEDIYATEGGAEIIQKGLELVRELA